jgi:hypothetical protein
MQINSFSIGIAFALSACLVSMAIGESEPETFSMPTVEEVGTIRKLLSINQAMGNFRRAF